MLNAFEVLTTAHPLILVGCDFLVLEPNNLRTCPGNLATTPSSFQLRMAATEPASDALGNRGGPHSRGHGCLFLGCVFAVLRHSGELFRLFFVPALRGDLLAQTRLGPQAIGHVLLLKWGGLRLFHACTCGT